LAQVNEYLLTAQNSAKCVASNALNELGKPNGFEAVFVNLLANIYV
jgi:hypothetical protein